MPRTTETFEEKTVSIVDRFLSGRICSIFTAMAIAAGVETSNVITEAFRAAATAPSYMSQIAGAAILGGLTLGTATAAAFMGKLPMHGD